jgi:hypothetical protein
VELLDREIKLCPVTIKVVNQSACVRANVSRLYQEEAAAPTQLLPSRHSRLGQVCGEKGLEPGLVTLNSERQDAESEPSVKVPGIELKCVISWSSKDPDYLANASGLC